MGTTWSRGWRTARTAWATSFPRRAADAGDPRALTTNPRLLILDEATEGLVPLIRTEIWRCLASLKASGLSTLVIDKNVDTLAHVADRHFLIEGGRVVRAGASHELAAAPDVQHRSIGV
jgi:branched-chain amino acid transport system ATP-binding protein